MEAAGNIAPLASLQGRIVLVAEDEYFLAADIKRWLRRAGAEVVGPFPTVRDALGTIEGGCRIDAALLDVNLRGDMVYPLADVLRQRGIPFVFMTGYDPSALPPAYREVPICDKPVRIHEFLQKLAALAGP